MPQNKSCALIDFALNANPKDFLTVLFTQKLITGPCAHYYFYPLYQFFPLTPSYTFTVVALLVV